MAGKQDVLDLALDRQLMRIRQGFAEDWLILLDGNGGGALAPDRQEALPENLMTVRPESHGFTELCICLRGKYFLGCGENSGFRMRPGDLCLMLPGAPHLEIPGEEYAAAWFSVDVGRAVAHLSGQSRGSPFTVSDLHVFRPGAGMTHIVESLRHAPAQANPHRSDFFKAAAVQLLAAFHNGISDTCQPKASDDWKNAIAAEAADYVRANIFTHIRLADIAQCVCMSADHLNAVFKAQTGKTIMQYHEECRTEAGKCLLTDGKRSINSIAAELGYYDQYHFSKAFKKATGLSPSALRRSAQKQESQLHE